MSEPNTSQDAYQEGLTVASADLCEEAGFVAPVLISRTVWDDCVAWTDADHTRTGALQDENGRLWDVLHMAAHAVRTMQQRHGDSWSEALFRVWRVARDAGPGEDGDVEATPAFLTALRSSEGITISRADQN